MLGASVAEFDLGAHGGQQLALGLDVAHLRNVFQDDGSSVSSAAAMAGSAAFFAPLMRMVPTSGLPPRMTSLSMKGFPVRMNTRARLGHGAFTHCTRDARHSRWGIGNSQRIEVGAWARDSTPVTRKHAGGRSPWCFEGAWF